jgi:sulfur-carrier protein adenylyltransferase/sulfurtransferase
MSNASSIDILARQFVSGKHDSPPDTNFLLTLLGSQPIREQSPMLTDKEKRRYSKQIMIPGFGEKGQEGIKAGKILVIGAGGLGCPVLQYLSAAGTGSIGLVEFDTVNESNIHRQILYGSGDFGKLKSIIAKNKLEQLNDNTEIEIFNLRLTAENIERISEKYEIIIDATDNYETRYVIDHICSEKKKPMIHGAIYQHEGQVSVFNYRGGSSYSSYNPYNPSKTLNPSPAETGLLGVLPGITGTLMACEALKIMSGTGEVMSGKLLTFNIMTNTYHTFIIK